jgi:DNA-binding LacI/PurR family transcriptional regulator
VQQVAGFVATSLGGTEPVDGILALTDFDASLIAGACRLLGKIPNRDVAIVGYDDVWDTEERAWEPSRPLATMDKRNAEIGKAAVELLNDRFEGRLQGAPTMRALQPRLVVPDADAPARES